MLISAEGGNLDVCCWDTTREELETVARREVDVPFRGILSADNFHGKAFLTKSIIHFVAYLKTFKRDTWTNLGMNIFSTSTINSYESSNALFYYAFNSASPTSMDSTDDLLNRVIEQYRDTVGCRYSYTNSRQISHQGIYTL